MSAAGCIPYFYKAQSAMAETDRYISGHWIKKGNFRPSVI